MPSSALLDLGRVLSRDGDLGASTEALVRRIPLFSGVLLLALSTAFAVRDLFVQDLGRVLAWMALPSARNWGATLFASALLARIAWVVLVPSVPVSDYREYWELAGRLVETGAFADASGMPTAFRPPGYPFFLAMFRATTGDSLMPVKLANAVLGACTCLLAWRVARLVLPEGPARLAGLLVAFAPSQVGYSSLLASEVPFTTLQTLALLWVAESTRHDSRDSWCRAALSGAALGAACMMRPTIALLPIALSLVLLVRLGFRRGGLAAICLCAAFAVFPTAWGARNVSALGSFQPFSTNGGVNFHFGNNAHTNGTGLELLDPAVDPTSGITDEVARNAEGWRLGKAYWRDHPWAAAVLAIRKIAWLLATDGVWTRWAMVSADPQPPPWARGVVLAASNAAWLGLLFAAVLELCLFRIRAAARASAEPFGEVMLACTILVAAAFIGQERYHFPMVPALAVAAAGFAARFVPATWRTSPTPPPR